MTVVWGVQWQKWIGVELIGGKLRPDLGAQLGRLNCIASSFLLKMDRNPFLKIENFFLMKTFIVYEGLKKPYFFTKCVIIEAIHASNLV